MELTEEMLIGMRACQDGFNWFLKQNETDVGKLIDRAIEDGTREVFNFANWGITRLLNHENRIRYAVFSAELVRPKIEEKYPNDDWPRKVIESAKAVIEDDSGENRERVYAAYAAAYAAYAAYVAAYAAYAADAADATADATADAAAYAAAYAADAAYVAENKEVPKKILEYGKKLLTGVE